VLDTASTLKTRKGKHMSLSLAIALNVIADAGLLGLLAYAMTRPARLRSHVTRRELRVVQLPGRTEERLRKAA
jgi:hypothetical protein